MRAPLAPPRLSRAAKVTPTPTPWHQLGDRQPEARIAALSARRRRVDQRVVDRGDRVLPDQLLGRHLGPEVARARAHVAVGELEPGAREGVGELRRVSWKRREIGS
jgi:hypothetical protein